MKKLLLFVLLACGIQAANTYTLDKNQQNAGEPLIDVAILHAHVATSSGTFTITCTATDVADWFVTATRFSGMNTATVDGTAGADTMSSTVTCGTITPTAGETLVVLAVMGDASGGAENPTAASGYTIPTNGVNSTGGSPNFYPPAAVEYQIVSSTSGSYSPTFTIADSTHNNSCATVGFKAN
jgi:hypothetical protein